MNSQVTTSMVLFLSTSLIGAISTCHQGHLTLKSQNSAMPQS